ncbi:hypothetical protein EXIGLDRAFT_765268 [Exidia glandulosa HHB12029]|uniref:Uncharacterized protein n=1 Tax=Exidia glandulosa HHB12029 TaxID=1314781 RepID=A0A166AZ58_EXIGL|nr:hypothetical protein EXIGLDRAFT_765268 [Exidia glandulosa HHB12029]
MSIANRRSSWLSIVRDLYLQGGDVPDCAQGFVWGSAVEDSKEPIMEYLTSLARHIFHPSSDGLASPIPAEVEAATQLVNFVISAILALDNLHAVPHPAVREVAFDGIKHLAQTLGRQPHHIVYPRRQRVLGYMLVLSRRTLPVTKHMKNMDAMMFFSLEQPVMPENGDELLHVLHQAIGPAHMTLRLLPD